VAYALVLEWSRAANSTEDRKYYIEELGFENVRSIASLARSSRRLRASIDRLIGVFIPPERKRF
jgi:hypothetical protein